jgi:hypothetical protein
MENDGTTRFQEGAAYSFPSNTSHPHSTDTTPVCGSVWSNSDDSVLKKITTNHRFRVHVSLKTQILVNNSLVRGRSELPWGNGNRESNGNKREPANKSTTIKARRPDQHSCRASYNRIMECSFLSTAQQDQSDRPDLKKQVESACDFDLLLLDI